MQYDKEIKTKIKNADSLEHKEPLDALISVAALTDTRSQPNQTPMGDFRQFSNYCQQNTK